MNPKDKMKTIEYITYANDNNRLYFLTKEIIPKLNRDNLIELCKEFFIIGSEIQPPLTIESLQNILRLNIAELIDLTHQLNKETCNMASCMFISHHNRTEPYCTKFHDKAVELLMLQ